MVIQSVIIKSDEYDFSIGFWVIMSIVFPPFSSRWRRGRLCGVCGACSSAAVAASLCSFLLLLQIHLEQLLVDLQVIGTFLALCQAGRLFGGGF